MTISPITSLIPMQSSDNGGIYALVLQVQEYMNDWVFL